MTPSLKMWTKGRTTSQRGFDEREQQGGDEHHREPAPDRAQIEQREPDELRRRRLAVVERREDVDPALEPVDPTLFQGHASLRRRLR
jgi:hypothetical protein